MIFFYFFCLNREVGKNKCMELHCGWQGKVRNIGVWGKRRKTVYTSGPGFGKGVWVGKWGMLDRRNQDEG